VSDRLRTRRAATISVASLVFVVIGLSLLPLSPFVGWTVVVFGAIGALQAVLVGLGLVTISDARQEPEREQEDQRPRQREDQRG
jgi:hypothetical protein